MSIRAHDMDKYRDTYRIGVTSFIDRKPTLWSAKKATDAPPLAKQEQRAPYKPLLIWGS